MLQEPFQDALLSQLDSLAVKMGMAAEHVWPYLIRQVYVEFWVATVGIVVLAVLFILSVRYTKGHKDCDGDPTFMAFVALFVTGFCTIILAVFWVDTIIAVLNPEYAAIRQLLP
jgi:hypothetical protein